MPPPVPAGYDRFTFRVVDSRTLTPLRGVCVVVGTATCTPDKPHTNALGLWWLDIPRSRAASLWDFRFFMDGYYTAMTQVTHTPGESRDIPIRLRHR